MGKRIRAQKIGKIKSRRVPSHRFKGTAKHPSLAKTKKPLNGKVMDIHHDPGRTAPVAKIMYEDGTVANIIAPAKLQTNSTIWAGPSAEIEEGNTLALRNIPEGTLVYNVEKTPGDGGKFGRASGTFVRIVTQSKEGTIVRMPSGTFKTLHPEGRATIGIVAGGGRKEKPFVKAGKKHMALRARGKLHPRVSGIHMNPCDHPYGGGNHPHLGKPKTVKRSTPPGRKIGTIAPKKTGRK